MSVKPNVRSLRRGCNQDHHGRYRDQSNDASHYLSPPFMSISTHIIGELDDADYQWEPVRTSEGAWELRPSPSRPTVMPLFTQVRGRGILGRQYAGSCIDCHFRCA